MNIDSFDDDFDDVSGAQPSASMHFEDAPDLSRSAWYDLEDEMPDANQAQVVVNHGPQPSSLSWAAHDSAQTMHRPAPFRQNDWLENDTSSLPTTVAPKALAAPSRWRNVFSFRLILLLIALFAVAGGAAFAKYLTVPATMHDIPVTQQVTHLAPRSSPTPEATSTPTPTAVPGLTLPAAWTASGRGTTDMLEAFAVAETFTQRYETIDFRSPGTLSAARFILTQAANARFSANDKRNTDQFAQQVQQERLVQSALIDGAQLVIAQQQNGNFFAWVTVSYLLAVQQGQGGTVPMQNLQMTVLLVAVPFDTPQDAPPMGGIGWLVSSYNTGNTPPAIPEHP